jgi:hypothetical protein
MKREAGGEIPRLPLLFKASEVYIHTERPGMRRKGIRIIEIATVCAVLGILASLAIPSFLRIQARSRVDRLLQSAKSCREELPHWLSASVSKGPQGSDTGNAHALEPLDPHGILEDYARIYNERFERSDPPWEGPVLVVEPTGTPPVYCGRDGRIHIIPFVGPGIERFGAKLVVTDQHRNGGPDYDGILAVYDVLPDGND